MVRDAATRRGEMPGSEGIWKSEDLAMLLNLGAASSFSRQNGSTLQVSDYT